jgi:hypothetical protein
MDWTPDKESQLKSLITQDFGQEAFEEWLMNPQERRGAYFQELEADKSMAVTELQENRLQKIALRKEIANLKTNEEVRELKIIELKEENAAHALVAFQNEKLKKGEIITCEGCGNEEMYNEGELYCAKCGHTEEGEAGVPDLKKRIDELKKENEKLKEGTLLKFQELEIEELKKEIEDGPDKETIKQLVKDNFSADRYSITSNCLLVYDWYSDGDVPITERLEKMKKEEEKLVEPLVADPVTGMFD